LQIVVNINENVLAAFEIPAENRKNRENNKREQARPKKISHLAKASGFISQLVTRATNGTIVTVGVPNKKARRCFRPGFLQFFQIALSPMCLVTMQAKTFAARSRCNDSLVRFVLTNRSVGLPVCRDRHSTSDRVRKIAHHAVPGF
jgi:hypothetical protein